MIHSLSGSGARPLQVTSLGMLRKSLQQHGIELARWGTDDAKTIENLWEEISTGEVTLQEDPLCRVLMGVVQLIIEREDGRILIEEEQIFEDGRRRKRNIPPSEKMLRGESYIEAARRCLAEELHVDPRNADILTFTHRMRQERRDSWSYPGLPSLYTIHQVHVRVPGLSQADRFTTSETTNPAEGTVREHIWVWKDAPPDLLMR
ncbi:MAG: hypothetical protein Kow0077_27590 [Anaerolineae bacterium]